MNVKKGKAWGDEARLRLTRPTEAIGLGGQMMVSFGFNVAWTEKMAVAVGKATPPTNASRAIHQRVPRLLIHYTALRRGGAERSLISLATALVERGCEVHLVLTTASDLDSEVDRRVTVHYLRTAGAWRPPASTTMRRIFEGPTRLVQWVHGRLQEVGRRLRFKGIRFDAAFVGRAGMSPDFVCQSVLASKRFVFVRNDPAVDQGGRWAARIRRYHRHIDGYICVSEFVRKAMAERFPEIEGKLVTIYNLTEPQRMNEKAKKTGNPFGGTTAVPRILSVCRLQERQKALLRMVDVHRRLLDAGLAHEWHVLGDGPDRGVLERAIEERGVSDTFRLHGAISNPFPYYVHADICAVLSRYEGLCGVVNEAKVLERPVIATRFSGIEEQIQSGVNGLIVEQDVASICEGMSLLLQDVELRQRLAMGGYPPQLLDDEAKIDALFKLIGKPSLGVAGTA